MKIKVLILAITCSMIMGCAPSIKITNEFQDPQFSFGQIKNRTRIRVFAAENVNLMEFKIAFRKEYSDDRTFAAEILRQVADSIKTIFGCSPKVNGESRDLSLLVITSFDEKNRKSLEDMFDTIPEDFFLIIKSMNISNRIEYHMGNYVSTGTGGGMMVGGGSTETCVVTMHAELWNVKERKKLISYAAVGESKVFMFFFGTALKAAVSESIQKMLRYLIDGSTI
jgi:hypothetical protein